MKAVKKAYVYPGGEMITYLYLYNDKGKCVKRITIKKEKTTSYVTRVYR